MFTDPGSGPVAIDNVLMSAGSALPTDWSVQMNFDSNDGMLKVYRGNGLNTVDVPYVPDEWIEIRVVIDSDADTTQIYYDGAWITEYSWTGGVLGGGRANGLDVQEFVLTVIGN